MDLKACMVRYYIYILIVTNNFESNFVNARTYELYGMLQRRLHGNSNKIEGGVSLMSCRLKIKEGVSIIRGFP